MSKYTNCITSFLLKPFSELNEKAQQCAQFLMAKNASAFAASKHWVRQSVKDQLLKAEQGMVDFRNIKGA